MKNENNVYKRSKNLLKTLHVIIACYSAVIIAMWPVEAQQEVGVLQTTGAVVFGVSSAMSGDGNTVVVGDSWDNNFDGSVYIFTRNGVGLWSQQGSKLIGTGGIRGSIFGSAQGSAVALSADGNTALVGGPDDNDLTGAAWVFSRTGSTWLQQGPKLVGTGSVGITVQGTSVAISGDGRTAFVGGPNDSPTQQFEVDGVGAVWVYFRATTTWSQQAKLVGTGAFGNSGQGYSVATNSDGNTVIIGAPWDNGYQGAIWVFTRSGSTWSQQGLKTVGAGAVGSSEQGYSVAVSNDGNTALVGGPSDAGGRGAAWVFVRVGGFWSQQGTKLVGSDTVGAANQGSSVSLSGDGNLALVMGNSDGTSSEGAIWVFVRVSGTWSQSGVKLVGANIDGVIKDIRSVSVSSTGLRAAVRGSNVVYIWETLFSSSLRPTKSPTGAPSRSPTPPTFWPTESPTARPTQFPSETPTVFVPPPIPLTEQSWFVPVVAVSSVGGTLFCVLPFVFLLFRWYRRNRAKRELRREKQKEEREQKMAEEAKQEEERRQRDEEERKHEAERRRLEQLKQEEERLERERVEKELAEKRKAEALILAQKAEQERSVQKIWLDRHKAAIVYFKMHQPAVGPDFHEFVAAAFGAYKFRNLVDSLIEKHGKESIPHQWIVDLDADFHCDVAPPFVVFPSANNPTIATLTPLSQKQSLSLAVSANSAEEATPSKSMSNLAQDSDLARQLLETQKGLTEIEKARLREAETARRQANLRTGAKMAFSIARGVAGF